MIDIETIWKIIPLLSVGYYTIYLPSQRYRSFTLAQKAVYLMGLGMYVVGIVMLVYVGFYIERNRRGVALYEAAIGRYIT